MVPEGWALETVGNLFDAQLGKMLNKTAKEKHPQFPYLGNTNVKWGRINFDSLNTMYFSEKEREKFSLENGDIFLCEGGEVGRCAIWKGKGEIYYQKALHRLRSKGRIIPEFFQAYMEKISGTKVLDDLTTRTSIAHLTREKLIELTIKLPPIAEQKKIAKTLSAWDKAIATTEQLLINSEQQKKAIMQQLLTGKKRLPGFGSPGKGGFSRKGLPDEWDYERVGNVAGEVADRNKGQEEIPVLSCSKYDGFVDSLKYFKKKVYSDDTSNYKIIQFGEFGFPSNHVEEGSIGLQLTYDRGIVSPIYVVFRVDPSRIEPFFLYKVLKSDHYRQVFAASTSASVDRRGSLRWKQFSGIKVPLPSIEEQKAISRVIQLAEKEEELLEHSLDRLRSEKKALMQQLLTGKRRVTIDGAE